LCERKKPLLKVAMHGVYIIKEILSLPFFKLLTANYVFDFLAGEAEEVVNWKYLVKSFDKSAQLQLSSIYDVVSQNKLNVL